MEFGSLFRNAAARLRSEAINLPNRVLQHAAHGVIARGVVLTLVLVLFGRAIGAAREIAVAARFGTSETADAYVFVLTFLTWPVAVWFNVLGAVLVPHVLAMRRKDSTHKLGEFRSNLFGLSLVAGLGCGVLLWIALNSSAFLSWLGFPDRTLALAHRMSLLLLPIVPIGFVSSYFSVWMMSSGRYVYTLFEAAPSLCVLAAIVLSSSAGIAPLVVGTLTGFLLHIVLLGASLFADRELSLPGLRLGGPDWRAFGTNFGVLALGQGLMTASVLIDQAMAAGLDAGTVAILGYTGRVLGVLLSIGALSINRATLPAFSTMRAKADPHLPLTALQWAALLFLAAALAACLAWFASPLLVRILFERGAFGEADTQAVTHMLSFAMVQVPFYCSGLVLTAYLAAARHYWFMTAIGALNLLLKPICNHFLILHFGPAGIVFASGVIYAISLAAMAVLIGSQARYRTQTRALSWNRL